MNGLAASAILAGLGILPFVFGLMAVADPVDERDARIGKRLLYASAVLATPLLLRLVTLAVLA